MYYLNFQQEFYKRIKRRTKYGKQNKEINKGKSKN